MENKMELNCIAKSDRTAEIMVKANITGLEMINVTIGIIDNLATNCTRNPVERAFFLKTVSKAVLKLL